MKTIFDGQLDENLMLRRGGWWSTSGIKEGMEHYKTSANYKDHFTPRPRYLFNNASNNATKDNNERNLENIFIPPFIQELYNKVKKNLKYSNQSVILTPGTISLIQVKSLNKLTGGYVLDKDGNRTTKAQVKLVLKTYINEKSHLRILWWDFIENQFFSEVVSIANCASIGMFGDQLLSGQSNADRANAGKVKTNPEINLNDIINP